MYYDGPQSLVRAAPLEIQQAVMSLLQSSPQVLFQLLPLPAENAAAPRSIAPKSRQSRLHIFQKQNRQGQPASSKAMDPARWAFDNAAANGIRDWALPFPHQKH